jgi:hypothetical protein
MLCLAGYFKTTAWCQSVSLVIKKQARDILTMRTLAPSKLSLQAFPSELFPLRAFLSPTAELVVMLSVT